MNNHFISKVDLPCTELNDLGSDKYAKLADIRTHFECNSVATVETVSKRQFFMFRAFTYTQSAVDDVIFCVRVKTGIGASENSIVVERQPDLFNIVMSYNDDGTISLWAKCKKYHRVKLQLLDGEESWITYYYDSKLDTDLSNIPNVSALNVNAGKFKKILYSSSNYVDCNGTDILVNTPVGGCVKPVRDGSIGLGGPENRYKGGYFTYVIQVPVRGDGDSLPSPLNNGYTFFHASSKKLITYLNGKWYCAGEEVKI